MAKESRRRYAVNFDLTIQQLRQFFDAEHPRKAYGQIARYMGKHGFSHRQWSGYVSDNTMTKPELLEFTMELHRNFPWLIKCEGSMDATVVTDVFDIRQMILDTAEDEDVDITL